MQAQGGLREWDTDSEARRQPAPQGYVPGGRMHGTPPALGKRRRATDLPAPASPAACAGPAGQPDVGDRGERREIGMAPDANPCGRKRERSDEPRERDLSPAKRSKGGARGRAAAPRPPQRSPKIGRDMWRPRTRAAIGAHGTLAPGSQSPERQRGAREHAGRTAPGVQGSPAGGLRSPPARASPGTTAGGAAGPAAAPGSGQRMRQGYVQERRFPGVSVGDGGTPGSDGHVRERRACGASGGGVSAPATANGGPVHSSPTRAMAGDRALHGRGVAEIARAAAAGARLAGGVGDGLAAAGSALQLDALAERMAQKLASSDAFVDACVARLVADDPAARGMRACLAGSAAFVEAFAAQVCNRIS